MLTKSNNAKQTNKDLLSFIKLLSDEQKIKLWIKTLISVQSNLPEIIKSVDRVIETNASSVSFISDIYNKERGTYAQVEKVIDLTERKNKLLNLYLISKNLLSGLAENDRTFVKRKLVYNWTAEELAIEYQISIRTVFRRIEKVINEIFLKCKHKNWSLNFINAQVKNESWLYEKFNRFAKDSMNSINEKSKILENIPLDTNNEKTLEDIA